MIGAHPDDEDTALLSYLARGESARTAYLSLTRGDGGQNIIGQELGESLGVIRTEELLQARRLDGAEQYFTRAYDYGFSKTLTEAKEKWDEKIILCDAVRVIRSFRPLVVVSQFSGTPQDGHGQHQFAGYISPISVKAAADTSQCSDSGPAWTVQKFYTRHRGPGEPRLRINTGKYDPLLGRSYFEIAMEARSQHKSQEQGVLELKGDQYSNLNLTEFEFQKAVSNCAPSTTDTPTAAYRRLYDAVKSKNPAAIRSEMSALSLDFGSLVSSRNGTQVERVFENGFTATTFANSIPEIRDQRISCEFGAVEVWNAKSQAWDDLPFIFENGKWSLAMGELFANKWKSPGTARSIAERGIFGGVVTSTGSLPFITQDNGEKFKDRAIRLGQVVESALSDFDASHPEKSLAKLVEGYKYARDAADSTRNPASIAFMNHKQSELIEAIRLAAGIQLDALADRETIVPGETVLVNVRTFLPFKEGVKGIDIKLAIPNGWSVAKPEPTPTPQQQGFFRREMGDFSAGFRVTAPSSELPFQPYWLKAPRNGDMFDWSNAGAAATLPVGSNVPRAVVKLDVLGTIIAFEQPIEFRFADDIRGEIRRNLAVVPNVSVELDQSLLIVPYSEKAQTRRIVMSVTNHSAKPVNGTVSLNINAPSDWKYTASSTTFDLKRTGEKATISFVVVAPAKTRAGSYQITAQAMIGEALATSTMRTIAYPHIQTHRFYMRAATDVKVFDLKTAPVKIGYVLGSGDRVPEAIKQMGFDIETITESELANGNLSKYDTIVVGIRAYQVRPDVVANNKRLLEYASNGGTLIVQYQLPGYAQQNLGPFPMQMGPRVADETAKVTILQPEHSIFNFPNKITDADFSDWVQERNLYNFSTMDPKYTGLLEAHDPGEPENKGGLVIADVGKGNYVYCSYSMFRQLPAGVPGAYRLFANILSLPKAKK